MLIQEMFADDINRKINGVIKVDQSAENVIEQELKEYVITRELKKHFTRFFDAYSESFNNINHDTGVWISGFFGSGKSHFLKMLSYLLSNREVNGKKTVEYFREKFEGDEATFMAIENSTKAETETILFNIDAESSIKKDNTAVLRVFAKMFYNHLGFYGENLRVAKLEQFLENRNKTEEFRQTFEEINGEPWLECRPSFEFFEDDVVATLKKVLGMSEESAQHWFDNTETTDISIAQLVTEIKAYLKKKPKNFRLIFLIDEVGQYIGIDTSMLLNLQTILEEVGSKCDGKVWVICTGQEAIDEIIKVRINEFSRIQARFKIRLSITSSSVDEVIQKRILRKTEEADKVLEKIYDDNEPVLRNLFTFKDANQDIKGFGGSEEFKIDYPFIPYQFIIVQKVFAEIRQHGNSGKHLSDGARSMLSGFQESAQKILDKNEYALAPFYLFYDTVHSFLDTSIRRVIERCEKAALNGDGIERQDVKILKLLYLIRYIDDIKSTVDNITILTAEDLRMDKIVARDAVNASLGRLLKENYIGRNADSYHFLTDDEQDIQRQIRNTTLSNAKVVQRIGEIIFGDIYTASKYRYKKFDIPFNQAVDGINIGSTSSGITLRVLTMAADELERNSLVLSRIGSTEITVVLAENSYYESVENAEKIKKFANSNYRDGAPESILKIIRGYMDESRLLDERAKSELEKAIIDGDIYIAGEKIDFHGSDVKTKLNSAMEKLITRVYSKMDFITQYADNDKDIINILQKIQGNLEGRDFEDNADAADDVYSYLEIQHRSNLTTTMADIQNRYSKIPYGWREIDIAAIVAKLFADQRINIKYAKTPVSIDDSKLPDMLRKKTEIAKTNISVREMIPLTKLNKVREILREYFDIMDVPKDEDSLIKFIIDKFNEKKGYLEQLVEKYSDRKYPGYDTVVNNLNIIKTIVAINNDNEALINAIIKNEDDLFDNLEDMEPVEDFFKNQKDRFNFALDFMTKIQSDLEFISKDRKLKELVDNINEIIKLEPKVKFNYKRIPELNQLVIDADSAYEEQLEVKRKDLLGYTNDCLTAIIEKAGKDEKTQKILADAQNIYKQRDDKIKKASNIALLTSMEKSIYEDRDIFLAKIEVALRPEPVEPPTHIAEKEPQKTPLKDYKPKKENIKSVSRYAVVPVKCLKTEAEIDEYVEKIRTDLKNYLKNCDGIQLN